MSRTQGATAGSRLWSRRRLLVLAGAVLLSPQTSPSVAQLGFDPLDLWRQLRARKLAKQNASKAVRAEDEKSGRGAVIRLVRGGGPGIALMIDLGRGPKIHAHTIVIRNSAGESTAVEPLPPHQVETTEGEWAIATMTEEHLDVLLGADTATVIVRGWDVEIITELDAKDLAKLRQFREKTS